MERLGDEELQTWVKVGGSGAFTIMARELLESRDRIEMGEAVLADTQKRLAAAEKKLDEWANAMFEHENLAEELRAAEKVVELLRADCDQTQEQFAAISAYDKTKKGNI